LDLVIDNEHEDGMDFNEALDVHEAFHNLTRATDWGKLGFAGAISRPSGWIYVFNHR
jgi:hypothetical protein